MARYTKQWTAREKRFFLRYSSALMRDSKRIPLLTNADILLMIADKAVETSIIEEGGKCQSPPKPSESK